VSGRIRVHTELEVYQLGMDAAMRIFEISKAFPREETYALTDQIRRCTRSVCANIAEAWRKRRYPAALVSKLSDAEAEAAEAQVWLDFALRCGYVSAEDYKALSDTYDQILGKLVTMIRHPEHWTLPSPLRRSHS